MYINRRDCNHIPTLKTIFK